MTTPQITIARKSGAAALAKRLAGITKLAAYVGVPASSVRDRSTQLLAMAGKVGKKKHAKLQRASLSDVTNAELLFVFSKGSPLHHQPPRPVVEPAIKAKGNAEPIAKELAEMAKAEMAGDHPAAVKHVKRAALYGQNVSRAWFTDARNNWAPNAPSTIKRKGSDRPGIDTGAMRAAIIGVVREE